MTEETTTNNDDGLEEFESGLKSLTDDIIQMLATYGMEKAPHPVSFCASVGQALMFFLEHLGSKETTMVIAGELMKFSVDQMNRDDEPEGEAEEEAPAEA